MHDAFLVAKCDEGTHSVRLNLWNAQWRYSTHQKKVSVSNSSYSVLL